MSRVRCCECAEIARGARFLSSSGTCAYCGKFAPSLTRDHIIPRVIARDIGGAENIALVCDDCNKQKGSLLIEEWLAQLPADAPQHIYAARFVQ